MMNRLGTKNTKKDFWASNKASYSKESMSKISIYM